MSITPTFNPIASGEVLHLQNVASSLERVSLYSSIGTLVFEKNINSKKSDALDLELPKLAAGVYTLCFYNKKEEKK